MDSLSVEIRFDPVDPERTQSLVGSIIWAIEHGVLTEEEAIEVIADELIAELLNGLRVIPVDRNGSTNV